MSSRVIAVVPARGGSKGIPRKNLQPVGGVPLIGFAIAAGLACPAIDTVIASTDDEEIAVEAMRLGARVPFMRSDELASDQAPMLDVLLDCIARMDQLGESFEYLVLLQPTTPFRNPEVLAQAIKALQQQPTYDSCVAVTPVIDSHPKRLRRIEDGCLQPYLAEGDSERQQRQDHAADKAYRRCGAFYITRVSTLRETGSLYGRKILPWIVEGASAVTIDEPYDLLLASAVWENEQQDSAVTALRTLIPSPGLAA